MPGAIRPLRRKDPATDTVQAVRDLQTHAEVLDRIEPLNGQLLTGVILSGATAVILRHSLGRRYLGGFVAAVSVAEPVFVQTPAEATGGGLGTGIDTHTHCVVFTAAAVAADTTVSVWIF